MANIAEVVSILKNAKSIVAFTGAGISVESGIPPFRGKNGLWSKYDMSTLELSYFYSHPKEVWKFVIDIFLDNFEMAQPNPAHQLLAKLEHEYNLKAVITQNIDNLHQMAGSENVIEYHGNCYYVVCTKCSKRYHIDELMYKYNIRSKTSIQAIREIELPPLCPDCGGILKPDIVFFGEPIFPSVNENAIKYITNADVVILIGTTGVVMPAAALPYMAAEHGAKIIEINIEPSVYTPHLTDILLQGKAGEISKEIIELL